MIFRYKHLVRLIDLDDEFIIDLQYYKSSNFFKKKFYNENECFLNESTALRLIKAKNAFKREGLLVKIWDAYLIIITWHILRQKTTKHINIHI